MIKCSNLDQILRSFRLHLSNAIKREVRARQHNCRYEGCVNEIELMRGIMRRENDGTNSEGNLFLKMSLKGVEFFLKIELELSKQISFLLFAKRRLHSVI